MKATLLTDAPYCRDVRAQRTVRALVGSGISLVVFDQGFEVEESRKILPERVKHFSSIIPSGKMARFVWHIRNQLAAHSNLDANNQAAYDVLSESAPDIIHLVNPFLGDAVLRYIEESPGCKLVYEAYEYWPEYLYDEEFGVNKSIRNHLANTEKELLQRCGAFITVSKPIAEFYEHIATPQTSYVIYNANVKESATLDQPEITVGAPLKIVFSGQFAADRNVDMLLQALNLMQHQVSVTLLGYGPQSEHYKRLIAQLDSARNAAIKNPVPADELIAELENYDVGIHLVSPQTLQQDGAAPNKIFDYIRANLGIVSVETKGVKSLGLDGCIAYVTPLCVQELAGVLDELAADRARVLAMKREAARLKGQYSSEHELQKIKSLYQKLISNE